MIAIHHNAGCGTSRTVLRLIEACGEAPVVIDYLAEGWTRAQLLGLFAAASLTPRTALREKAEPAAALGLLDPDAGDAAILDAMIAHPVLVNRPIVCSPLGVRLCRPAEAVIPILPRPPRGPLSRDNGAPLLDGDGRLIAG